MQSCNGKERDCKLKSANGLRNQTFYTEDLPHRLTVIGADSTGNKPQLPVRATIPPLMDSDPWELKAQRKFFS